MTLFWAGFCTGVIALPLFGALVGLLLRRAGSGS